MYLINRSIEFQFRHSKGSASGIFLSVQFVWLADLAVNCLDLFRVCFSDQSIRSVSCFLHLIKTQIYFIWFYRSLVWLILLYLFCSVINENFGNNYLKAVQALAIFIEKCLGYGVVENVTVITVQYILFCSPTSLRIIELLI